MQEKSYGLVLVRWLSVYGGGIRNSSTWFLVDGVLWRGLLDEEHHWERALRVYVFDPLPAPLLDFLYAVKMCSLNFTFPHHATPPLLL